LPMLDVRDGDVFRLDEREAGFFELDFRCEVCGADFFTSLSLWLLTPNGDLGDFGVLDDLGEVGSPGLSLRPALSAPNADLDFCNFADFNAFALLGEVGPTGLSTSNVEFGVVELLGEVGPDRLERRLSLKPALSGPIAGLAFCNVADFGVFKLLGEVGPTGLSTSNAEFGVVELLGEVGPVRHDRLERRLERSGELSSTLLDEIFTFIAAPEAVLACTQFAAFSEPLKCVSSSHFCRSNASAFAGLGSFAEFA